MIAPLLITGGVLALLYASRTPPATSASSNGVPITQAPPLNGSRLSREDQILLRQTLATLPPPHNAAEPMLVTAVTRDTFPHAGATIDVPALRTFTEQLSEAYPDLAAVNVLRDLSLRLATAVPQ